MQAPEINDHVPSRAEPIEETEKNKHAQHPAQTPASRVSKNAGGNTRQERMNAVSGRKDRRHRADKRVGKTTPPPPPPTPPKKKKRANLQRSTWHNNVKAPSGQPLADFDTLPSAEVKVARAQWYGQHAIVFTTEKVQPRGKTAKVLIDCLVLKLSRTWWQWCHTSTFAAP